MGIPQLRFTLSHILTTDILQFSNNEFATSITGWDQINSGSDINFSWNSPSSARASGASSNTSAIGQSRNDNPGIGWPAGTYTVAITATNTSTGGSSPFTSGLNLYGSDTGAALDDVITFSGGASWDVGAGTITRTITFTLTQSYKKLFFKFVKQGPSTGYNVVFTIDSIIITNLDNVGDDQVITEPDGWQDAELKLDRHPDFHSLIETFESDFVFYGSDGVVNGGLDFIRSKIRSFGVNTEITITVELSFDSIVYETIFSGLLDLSLKKDMPDNKISVPIDRNDLWTKFMNRIDTPVDLLSTTDLDGNAVTPVEFIDINLPYQKTRRNYSGENKEIHGADGAFAIGDYFQMDYDIQILNEIEKKYNLVIAGNTAKPASLFDVEEKGTYHFKIQSYVYFKEGVNYTPANVSGNPDYVNFFLDINGTQYKFHWEVIDLGGVNGINRFFLDVTIELNKGDAVRLYGRAEQAFNGLTSFFIWNAKDFYYSNNYISYLQITADTVAPSSTGEGFLIHDAFAGVIQRIIGKNAFYSEILGSTTTNMRAYASNGCFWNFALIKGLQVRGYTLSEKPFFVSFSQLWKGANPIFNLGLSYETIGGTEYIRLEDKEHFYDSSSSSTTVDNLEDFFSGFDNNRAFKKIQIGYNKWQSEDISGLDDPQTKHTYATLFERNGSDITLHSEFIAASLAIELTRRQGKFLSKDYKYDNDTFIIHLSDTVLSPDRYRPVTNEHFDSISNLLNADMRYNSILTPLHNFLRWAPYFNGALQKYLTSKYRFVSGEGNYDMVSDYSCSLGKQCLGVICDSLSEKGDIDLSVYGPSLGYIHLPDFIDYTTSMAWETYNSIRNNRKKAVGVSQTDSNYKKFFVKSLKYKLCEAKAEGVSWAAEEFDIIVPDSNQPAGCR